MHLSGAFEDLMRNAIMNASLQRSYGGRCVRMWRACSAAVGEPLHKSICFGAQENIAE